MTTFARMEKETQKITQIEFEKLKLTQMQSQINTTENTDEIQSKGEPMSDKEIAMVDVLEEIINHFLNWGDYTEDDVYIIALRYAIKRIEGDFQ